MFDPIPRQSGPEGCNRVRRSLVPISWCALILLVSGLVGCTTPAGRSSTTRTTVAVPGSGEIEIHTDSWQTEETVIATPREVWAVLPSVFDLLEIEATEIDPRQRIMRSELVRPRRIEGKRLSTYVECGRDFGGAYADTRDLTLSFGVQLLSGPNGSTLVSSVLTGSARPRGFSGQPVPCQSKRTLEARLLELIGERIAARR